MGTPNREPQEFSKNRIESKDPARYIPALNTKPQTLRPYSWGSLFGVPIKVPHNYARSARLIGKKQHATSS